MTTINSAILDLKQLDLLGRGNTRVHELDARAKVLVTLFFIICIVSFNKYELTALFPFFIFLVVMATWSSLPLLFLAKKTLLFLPFVAIIGAFNPLLDREIIGQINTFTITGGWISYASILIRSVLTIGAAFILVGSTGFTCICLALKRLGMPHVFTVQLLFLYRYIFVLAEEGNKASRARELRTCGKKGFSIQSFTSLAGHLLLRTWQRAEHIYMAMLSRGFTGEFHTLSNSRFGVAEVVFVVGWSALFIFMRLQNVSELLGQIAFGVLL